jgi:hypothetical protein
LSIESTCGLDSTTVGSPSLAGVTQASEDNTEVKSSAKFTSSNANCPITSIVVESGAGFTAGTLSVDSDGDGTVEVSLDLDKSI